MQLWQDSNSTNVYSEWHMSLWNTYFTCQTLPSIKLTIFPRFRLWCMFSKVGKFHQSMQTHERAIPMKKVILPDINELQNSKNVSCFYHGPYRSRCKILWQFSGILSNHFNLYKRLLDSYTCPDQSRWYRTKLNVLHAKNIQNW